jgi:hypothetical protein
MIVGPAGEMRVNEEPSAILQPDEISLAVSVIARFRGQYQVFFHREPGVDWHCAGRAWRGRSSSASQHRTRDQEPSRDLVLGFH